MDCRKFFREQKKYSSSIVVLLLNTSITINILEKLKFICFLSLPIILMDTRRHDLPQIAKSERRHLYKKLIANDSITPWHKIAQRPENNVEKLG